MRYDRYKNLTDVKDVMIQLYNNNAEAKLLIDDIIIDEWESIGFESFINTACDEALWEVVDLLADDKDIRADIDRLIIFEEEPRGWEECDGFASKQDFNKWWYGR